MTLKLSQKGYVLVLVPLLFQLGMMLCLMNALNQAEQELKRAEYVKGLNYHFTMLTALVVKLVGDAHLKGAESLNLDEFRKARKKIEAELVALRQLSSTNGVASKYQRCWGCNRSLLSIFQRGKKSAGSW